MSATPRSILLSLLAGLSLIAGVAGAGAQAAPKPQPAYDLGGGQGRVEYREYGLNAGVLHSSLTYLPSGWTKAERLPVYVMVHGCGTTAAQQMGANLLNPIADRERFIVLYPDNDGNCWRGVSEDVLLASPHEPQRNRIRGGGGDADSIAQMTKDTLARYRGDADRVYMIGMSSGAFQVSHTAVAYPELYAAVGVTGGGGPGMAVTCLGHTRASVPAYARTGIEQMGERARVMPFFTISGTEDPLGEMQPVTGCARLAYLEWLYINNTLSPAEGVAVPGAASQLLPEEAAVAGSTLPRDTFMTDLAATRTGQVPGGHSWTAYSARDPKGCELGQRWVVEGMGHYWSGGSTDPKYTGEQPTPSGGTAPGFNDPKGPSASQASWDFFKQFSLANGNVTCSR